MKKLSLSIVVFVFYSSSNCSAQDYFSKMMGYIEQQDFKQGFEFGNKTIFELKLKKRRNYYLEFFTWACLAMYNDPKTKHCGCVMLNDYMKINGNNLPADMQDILQAKADTICLKNVNIKEGLRLKTNNVISYHSRSKDYAVFDAHFKSYHILKESVKSKNLFSRLSQNDFLRVMSYAKTNSKVKETPDSTQRQDLRVLSKKENIDTVALYINRIYPGSSFYQSANFVVASKAVSNNKLKETAAELEKVLQFYNRSLGLPKNDSLIMIYLSSSYESVSDDIAKIYGIKNIFPIGFTDLSSRSMVAWLPGSKLVGTLKHELIHALLHNELIFAPSWFEEGLATLYEESRFDSGGELKGITNWRKSFLKALPPEIMDSLFIGMINSDNPKLKLVEYAINREVDSAYISAKNHQYYQYLKEDVQLVISQFGALYISFCKDAMARYILLNIQSRGELKQSLKLLSQNDQISFDNLNYKSFNDIFLDGNKAKTMNESAVKFRKWFYTFK